MKFRNSIMLSIAIFCLPIIITSFYKLIEISIGPVVLFYSIAGGILVGFTWIGTIQNKWGELLGMIIGVLIGIIAIILLLNFFILVTWVMGEMDYALL